MNRFEVIVVRYGRWFDEEEIVVAKGQVMEQMEISMETYKKLRGPNDISIRLVDVEKGDTIEEHRF